MKNRRVIIGAACIPLVLVIGLFLLQRQAPTWLSNTPPLPVAALQDVTDNTSNTGRRSEHFQIVDDVVSGDVDASGDVGAVRGIADDASVTVPSNATVIAVADGDTFDVRLDNGVEARVRLLGVDTPETVDPRKPVQCYGKEASDEVKRMLTDARVLLEADPLADERDIYGRLLRNVITEAGVDINRMLVADGFARAYLAFPMDPVRKKQLSDLEAEARASEKGLWGSTCRGEVSL